MQKKRINLRIYYRTSTHVQSLDELGQVSLSMDQFNLNDCFNETALRVKEKRGWSELIEGEHSQTARTVLNPTFMTAKIKHNTINKRFLSCKNEFSRVNKMHGEMEMEKRDVRIRQKKMISLDLAGTKNGLRSIMRVTHFKWTLDTRQHKWKV